MDIKDVLCIDRKGLPKSLEAFKIQPLQEWRLAESNHEHMDFQYYVVHYVLGTYEDQ